ncbi:hypothetical protein E3N88_18414 [Mikania micrantha]|uniref:Uncharacterized protein n=1 Tax=Mikania micrantha TaxID=192012 RepID=A0A5N6NN43_9ASTR|nr:hypothetical protein E3N88_18414 [Mikania micrantha]
MSNDLRSWFVTFPNGMIPLVENWGCDRLFQHHHHHQHHLFPEEDPEEDPEDDPEEDPDEDPDEDPEEEPVEGTQEIPAEGPSTHPPPVLDVPEPKRQRTDAEEIAKLREDLYWANDRIEYNVRELWDANERQNNLAHLVNDMRDEMINLIGRLEASENRAEILEGRLEALEDLVASENEEEDEEEEGEEPAPVVDSDPESTRNRIIKIEKQGSGLIAVRDGPSAKGFAVREENRELRLPNPITIVGTTRKPWNPSKRRKIESQPLEGPPEAVLVRFLPSKVSQHCVTGDCDPDNLLLLAPQKGRDFSGCDRLVSETPVIAN